MTPFGYLLDTNAISATRQSYKEPRVAELLRSLDPSTLFISVLTFGEIRKGLTMKRLKTPNGVENLSRWVEQVERVYASRALDVDAGIAKLWGELMGGNRTLPVVDTLLAATAIVHNLTLVTRNTSVLEGLPVQLFNPWLA
ncbi:MAG: type II toxin-antitoxin system VapC family toxin [Acidobacteriaceae bacterium]